MNILKHFQKMKIQINPRRNSKIRMSNRPRTTLRQKMKFIVPGVLSLMMVVGMMIYFQISKVENVRAAVSGDYRTKATGNWNSTSTWEKYDGSSWVSAAATPASGDGVIEILSGHTVTITADVTADQIIVNSGGTL